MRGLNGMKPMYFIFMYFSHYVIMLDKGRREMYVIR